MSYTEIYKFNKKGDAEFLDEVKNSFRGAMAIWIILEKKYLPKYVPTWAMGDTSKEYSRTSDFMGGGLKEIWGLFESDKVSEVDKLVLGTTFDKVIVKKEDLENVVKAFREFEGETSLKEQADIIEKALKEDEDLIAIAWNQTSVNSGVWESDSGEEDEDGNQLPYNILNSDKHWDLFEDLKK